MENTEKKLTYTVTLNGDRDVTAEAEEYLGKPAESMTDDDCKKLAEHFWRVCYGSDRDEVTTIDVSSFDSEENSCEMTAYGEYVPMWVVAYGEYESEDLTSDLEDAGVDIHSLTQKDLDTIALKCSEYGAQQESLMDQQYEEVTTDVYVFRQGDRHRPIMTATATVKVKSAE